MEDKLLKNVLEECRRKFQTSADGIGVTKEFKKGKSGNGVYLIEVRNPNNTVKVGRYILKISCQGDEEFFSEIQNTIDLSKEREKQSEILFPAFEFQGKIEDTLFYVYDVAGSELADTIEISGSMPYGESFLEKFSRDLLLFWNSNFFSKQLSLIECIEKTIEKTRLGLEGRIYQRIERFIGDPLCPSFRYDGKAYPNPYYYLKNNQGPLSRNINAVLGNIHGDLNGNNIIVSKNIIDNQQEVYLIDYSHYKNDGCLFMDHAYLQLDMLLSGENASNVYEWTRLVEDDLDADIKAGKKYNFQFIRYIREGIVTFINKNQPNNKEDCWIQYWCMQICAGLNWMNKKNLSEAKQALAFLYASVCLKELFRVLQIDVEETAENVLTLLGDDVERNIWKIFDKFNTEDNRYILLSACNTNNIDKASLSALSAVTWEGIFELTENTENENRDFFLNALKKKYGIQYRFFPDEERKNNYELSPYWCTIQIPREGSVKMWYIRNVKSQVEGLVKSILRVRENYPVYVIVDGTGIDRKIIEEIITGIQINVGMTSCHIVVLNNVRVDVEQDDHSFVEYTSFSLEDIARCIALAFSREEDSNKIYLPQKGEKGEKDRKVYLEEEEANYIKIDFEIIHSNLRRDADSDGGRAFYRGSEPSWRDISEHRDIDRTDYVNVWKQDITERLQGIGTSTVIASHLFHRAGAGGSTLARRILWDFHAIYPCLFMKKLGTGTSERLKLVYGKTKLPLLIVVEITAGQITQTDISKLRLELLNKGVRAMFICVSRIHNLEAKRHPTNYYLASTPDMIMGADECERMCEIYQSMTLEDHCKENLRWLTYDNGEEWKNLRQPFFYGLFTFDKEYTSIRDFVIKGLQGLDKNMIDLITMLAFMTKYAQIGLNKNDIDKLFQIDVKTYSETDPVEINPLIVRKSAGYRICHPIIAEQILLEIWKTNNTDKLYEYAIDFIDKLTGIYSSDSIHLSDIMEEIFTHREYYVDEEKRKFSNLIMEFGDDQKKKNIFGHLISKLPDNPHYYNHLARVYIYPSESGNAFDFEKAVEIADEAIKKAELSESEGSGIHHHLMGKIYTKKCKAMISNSKFRGSVGKLWKEIKPIYEKANKEFSECKTENNLEFGLIGKMELISGILLKIRNQKRSSINYILLREPQLKSELVELIREMHTDYTEYSMKFRTDNPACMRAVTDFHGAMGNVPELQRQLSLKKLSLNERINTRRALVALEIWRDGEKNSNFYEMPQERLNKIFDYLSQNINESCGMSNYDRIMWFKVYMRREDYSVFEAYNFLLEWPDGDKDYYVCFYRYVLSFILYCKGDGDIDYSTVMKHLKQSSMLAKKTYGLSVTSTRELVGECGDVVYLIPDNIESKMGRLNNEEREKYRRENCKFFDGIITDFQNSIIYISFSLDNEHNFTAKMPTIDAISGMNVGDRVRFALGFSYSEMRAWNVTRIATNES